MARARQAAHNAPAVIPPQGRLTLTTGTPVMTAEAAAQTTIYYTPYVGYHYAAMCEFGTASAICYQIDAAVSVWL